MKNYQEHKLSAIEEILLFAVLFSIKIEAIPALSNAFAKLKSIRNTIREVMDVQQLVITGYTTLKNNLKNACFKQTLKIGKALAYYGYNNADFILSESMSFSKRTSIKHKDEEVLSLARMVYQKAIELGSLLADYGISEEDVTYLSQTINDFDEKFTEPKNAKSAKTISTQKLAILIAEAMKLLKNEIDPMIWVAADDGSDFKAAYKNARKIERIHKTTKKVIAPLAESTIPEAPTL